MIGGDWGFLFLQSIGGGALVAALVYVTADIGGIGTNNFARAWSVLAPDPSEREKIDGGAAL